MQEYSDLKTQSWAQADRDGEGSPTESGMLMDSIPMRKRSRKPKHVYNAADVAPLQAPWKASTFKPKKVCCTCPCKWSADQNSCCIQTIMPTCQ